MQHVVHSIPPVFDARSRVLILGSFPSPKSREMGFYYGHPQNRFWTVLSTILKQPFPQSVEQRKRMALAAGIALWDVVQQCDIEGAADTSIQNVVCNDISMILRAAPIRTIYTTGGRAHQLYTKYCEKDVGRPAVRLPSTSPANCTVHLPQLCEQYSRILKDL